MKNIKIVTFLFGVLLVALATSCGSSKRTTQKEDTVSQDTLRLYCKLQFDSLKINPKEHADEIQVYTKDSIVYTDSTFVVFFKNGEVIRQKKEYKIPQMTPGKLDVNLSKGNIYIINYQINGVNHFVPYEYGTDESHIYSKSKNKTFEVEGRKYILADGSEGKQIFFILKDKKTTPEVATGYPLESKQKTSKLPEGVLKK